MHDHSQPRSPRCSPCPPAALAATKPVPVNLGGVTLQQQGEPEGDPQAGRLAALRLEGRLPQRPHAKAPAKANKVNSGEATDKHKPIVFKPTKKGKYVFYCEPHKSLGMVLTLTVK